MSEKTTAIQGKQKVLKNTLTNEISIWGIIPVPAPLLVVIYAVIEVGSQFLGRNTGVAHLTHLTGFALAWIYLVVRMGLHPIKIWKDAYRR